MIEGASSRDFEKAKAWAYGDSSGFARLIDILVNATSDYLLAQIDAGVDAVQIFDSSGRRPGGRGIAALGS